MAHYYWKWNRRGKLKNDKGQVSLGIYFEEERVIVWRDSKVWVKEGDWDAGENYLRRRMPDYKIIDRQLTGHKEKYHAIELQYDIYTPQILKEHRVMHSADGEKTFIKFMEVYNNNQKGKSMNLYLNTKATINLLKRFDPRLSFTRVSRPEFVDDFHDFLLKRNYAPTTIDRYHRDVKKYLRIAYRRNKVRFPHGLFPYEGRSFDKTTDDDNIILTDQEMQSLYDFNFSRMPMLEKARDVFLIGYYTVTRFGDYSNLRKENFITKEINGTKIEVMRRVPEKTPDRVVMVPIHPNLKKILVKYRYDPPKMSNQKLNEYIKTICLYAGIKDEVQVTRIRGGKTHRTKRMKYELIGTHTARRSGATTLVRLGVPRTKVMMLTGHSTEKTFNKYVKLSGEDVAYDLAQMDYYKP